MGTARASRTRATIVLLVAALYGCAGSSAVSPSATVHTSGAAIEVVPRHRTYRLTTALEAPEGYAKDASVPVVLGRVAQMVDGRMQLLGYQPANDGELVVRLAAGQRKVEAQPTGAMAAAGAPSTSATEGAIVVDLIEASSGRTLFHGLATDVLHGELTDAQIDEVTSRIMDAVPEAAW
jgi:hypothetical protein